MNLFGTDADHFDLFWSSYPRRIGKGAARVAFKRALKRVSLDELLEAVEYFRHTEIGRDKKFCPYPATWLNQDRWADERSEWGEYRPPQPERKQEPTTTDFEMWRASGIRQRPDLREKDDQWWRCAWEAHLTRKAGC